MDISKYYDEIIDEINKMTREDFIENLRDYGFSEFEIFGENYLCNSQNTFNNFHFRREEVNYRYFLSETIPVSAEPIDISVDDLNVDDGEIFTEQNMDLAA